MKNLAELSMLFRSNRNNIAQYTHLRHGKMGVLLNQCMKFKLKDTETHVTSHIRICEPYLNDFPNVLTFGIYLSHIQIYSRPHTVSDRKL